MDMKADMSYYRGSRREVFELAPRGVSRILEIGCGSGRFRDNFPPDVEYWGVEPVPSAAAEATRLSKVLVGTLDDVETELPDGYFDLVVCNDVLEHIFDSEKTLAIIRRKLSPAGYLIGSLPNVRSVWVLLDLLFRKDWRYRDSGILDNTHVRFFTFKSAKRMLRENGFAIDVFKGRSLGNIWWCKILMILIAPLLCIVGWDICRTQMLFRAKPSTRKHSVDRGIS